MYIGPETLMPLASVLAAITGVIMLFWRKTVEGVRSSARFVQHLFTRLFDRP